MRFEVKTFKVGTPKDGAKKIPEEAAEAFAEWVALNGSLVSSTKLADELADCIQACCNLAARYDIDMEAAMRRCEVRNRARGRYE